MLKMIIRTKPLNSLLSILELLHGTFWCVFFFARESYLSQIEEPLPCSSKVKDTRAIGDLLRACLINLIAWAYTYFACIFQRTRDTWIINMISREELHLWSCFLSLISCMTRTLAILLLPSTLTQAKTFVPTFNTSFQTLET